MEHLLEGIAPLKDIGISLTQMRRVTNTNLLSELTYQSLNGALPSRKCSIKAPAKCKTSVYVCQDGDLPLMK